MQSRSLSPILSTQLTQLQLKARRMILLGQKVAGAVESPSMGPSMVSGALSQPTPGRLRLLTQAQCSYLSQRRVAQGGGVLCKAT